LDNITPLHHLKDKIAEASCHLYPPRDSYRMHFRFRSFGRTERVPEYLQPGVMIDYFLAGNSDDAVVLEIRDAVGNLVRSFSSRRQSVSLEGLGFQDMVEAMKRTGGTMLPSTPGMHRLFWDMRHAGAWTRRASWSRGGPMVSPGTYQAKLMIGDWTHTERFRMLIDPRVKKDGVTQEDLVAQESLSLQVRDLLSKANRVAKSILEARESEDVAQKDRAELDLAYEKLVTGSGPYPQPQLIDQISYLFSMLNSADQKPGRDAYVRRDELKQELDLIVAGVEEILNK
jgi:hypothetical protein